MHVKSQIQFESKEEQENYLKAKLKDLANNHWATV